MPFDDFGIGVKDIALSLAVVDVEPTGAQIGSYKGAVESSVGLTLYEPVNARLTWIIVCEKLMQESGRSRPGLAE
jgi:hypothetical protein